MIFDHPILGMGSGMFQVKFFQYVEELANRDESGAMPHMMLAIRNRATDNAHNDLLQFWVETGAIGFMLFMLFLASYFVTITRSILEEPGSNYYKQIQMGMLAAVLSISISAGFSFPLHLPVRASLFWVLSALSCSLYFMRRKQGEIVS